MLKVPHMNVFSQSNFKKYVVITECIGICNQSFWPTCPVTFAFGGAIYSVPAQSFSVSLFWGFQPLAATVGISHCKKKKKLFSLSLSLWWQPSMLYEEVVLLSRMCPLACLLTCWSSFAFLPFFLIINSFCIKADWQLLLHGSVSCVDKLVSVDTK